LVLGLTVAGFIIARVQAERDARHDSQERVDIAAAQVRSRVEVATSLTASLSRFMFDEGFRGVTNAQFKRTALRWLSPADFPTAAWAEQVRAADRAEYERRIGRPIVAAGARRTRAPPARSYLPATLISGSRPFNLPGLDLSRETGIAAALRGAQTGVGATPIEARSNRTRGLFLVAPASNVIGGVPRPGAVVVFVSEANLRAAARSPVPVRFPPAGRSSAGGFVRDEFAVAGQQFAVAIPTEPVTGPGAVLPWIILAGGLWLASLAGALGVIAARRARAQQDLDRIFNLSPDVVTVANFDGRFTRVNPAAEQILGYSEDELLSRPYLDFVHPDDREKTAAEAAAISQGKATLSFENRFLRKDGSTRVLEWTATPVVADAVMYGVARDVTERREAEIESERLAAEQTALRRVATLVVEGVASSEVLGAVAREVGTLLGADFSGMIRYGDGATVSTVAAWAADGEHPALPETFQTEAGDPTAMVAETGEPARVDDWTAVPGPIAAFIRDGLGVRSSVGCPIIVDGRLWGALAVHSRHGPLPAGTESRVAQFTDLAATAIASAEARAEVERLAEEQAELRRVATLVAEGASPTAVFDAVAGAMERLMSADQVVLSRHEGGNEHTIVAHVGISAPLAPPGSRFAARADSVQAVVGRTGRPARYEHFEHAQGEIADLARRVGVRSVVGAPIVVDGRPWGVVSASWNHNPTPAPDTEARMTGFSELLATAIANADGRDQLNASRVRLLTAGDEARRHVVRDLHDGAQQRLVHTIVTLKLAQRALRSKDDGAGALVDEALAQAERGNAELRELAHGILPAVLVRGGIQAGLEALAVRLDLPVQLDIVAERFAAEIEASAYFIAAEALTNVVKHAHAQRAEVRAAVAERMLHIAIRDDGVGGADPDGPGLVGLADRATALGGRLEVAGLPGGGTLVTAVLPLPAG
jgi:PAS domain S-box-containing protein